MYAVMLMGIMHGEPSDASLCKNCGACAKKCPQHIAIPDELKVVKGNLGGLQTKIMLPIIKRMAKRQFTTKLE
jgi:predicted aldo/keto reductase-like oxidoreductase